MCGWVSVWVGECLGGCGSVLPNFRKLELGFYNIYSKQEVRQWVRVY